MAGSTIEQYKVTATTDASGDASLTLVVPAGGVTGVSYRFTLTDTTRYELTVASGTSIAFADLLLVDTLPLVDGVTATLADLRTDVDANTAHAGGVTTFHGLTVSTASTVFGYLATPSLFSTAIGAQAGSSSASYNTSIGYNAGKSATASGATFLGHTRGVSNATANKLEIGNASGAIIEGIMSGAATATLDLNAAVTIRLASLPTSDPSDAGALWNDSGNLKISLG